jgi:hypothetical protein
MLNGLKMELARRHINTDGFKDRIVKVAIQGLRKLLGRINVVQPKKFRAKCTSAILLKCLPHWRTTTVGQRNAKRAAIIALSGTFRLGELCATRHNEGVVPLRKHISRLSNNRRSIHLWKSKADKWYLGTNKIINPSALNRQLCAVSAIDLVIFESHIDKKPNKAFLVNELNEPISAALVMTELRFALTAANLPSVTDAVSSGSNEKQIKKMGPWRTDAWRTYAKDD